MEKLCFILDLPNEILILITKYYFRKLEYETFKEIKNFSLVCKQFYQLTTNSLWKEIIDHSIFVQIYLHFIKIDNLWVYQDSPTLIANPILFLKEFFSFLQITYPTFPFGYQLLSDDDDDFDTCLFIKFAKSLYGGKLGYFVTDCILLYPKENSKDFELNFLWGDSSKVNEFVKSENLTWKRFKQMFNEYSFYDLNHPTNQNILFFSEISKDKTLLINHLKIFYFLRFENYQ